MVQNMTLAYFHGGQCWYLNLTKRNKKLELNRLSDASIYVSLIVLAF